MSSSSHIPDYGQHNCKMKGSTVLASIIQPANYPHWLSSSGDFASNSTKLICLEITGYQIMYRTVK
jgi:hypothetical protein